MKDTHDESAARQAPRGRRRGNAAGTTVHDADHRAVDAPNEGNARFRSI
ncbi:MAG: hypothetical protein U1E83_01415 [Methylotetracoccus sp.]